MLLPQSLHYSKFLGSKITFPSICILFTGFFFPSCTYIPCFVSFLPLKFGRDSPHKQEDSLTCMCLQCLQGGLGHLEAQKLTQRVNEWLNWLRNSWRQRILLLFYFLFSMRLCWVVLLAPVHSTWEHRGQNSKPECLSRKPGVLATAFFCLSPAADSPVLMWAFFA